MVHILLQLPACPIAGYSAVLFATSPFFTVFILMFFPGLQSRISRCTFISAWCWLKIKCEAISCLDDYFRGSMVAQSSKVVGLIPGYMRGTCWMISYVWVFSYSPNTCNCKRIGFSKLLPDSKSPVNLYCISRWKMDGMNGDPLGALGDRMLSSLRRC